MCGFSAKTGMLFVVLKLSISSYQDPNETVAAVHCNGIWSAKIFALKYLM